MGAGVHLLWRAQIRGAVSSPQGLKMEFCRRQNSGNNCRHAAIVQTPAGYTQQ
jgi:hypothetical protein